jgi:hypothetical protein
LRHEQAAGSESLTTLVATQGGSAHVCRRGGSRTKTTTSWTLQPPFARCSGALPALPARPLCKGRAQQTTGVLARRIWNRMELLLWAQLTTLPVCVFSYDPTRFKDDDDDGRNMVASFDQVRSCYRC